VGAGKQGITLHPIRKRKRNKIIMMKKRIKKMEQGGT
jgi:hypothetical protein